MTGARSSGTIRASHVPDDVRTARRELKPSLSARRSRSGTWDDGVSSASVASNLDSTSGTDTLMEPWQHKFQAWLNDNAAPGATRMLTGESVWVNINGAV